MFLLLSYNIPPECCLIVLYAIYCSHGVDVRHLWGMTELSPLGTLGTLTPGLIGDGITRDEMLTAKVRRFQIYISHCSWCLTA